MISPVKSREEVPVKPLPLSIDEPEFVEIEKPKKTFNNFLRRGQNMKYDPKKALNKPLLEDEQEEKDLSEPVSQNIEKKVGFKDFQKIKYSQEAEESDYSESEPKDQNKPTFNFLKRKSQTYKPTKLE